MLNKLSIGTKEKIAALVITLAWVLMAKASSNPETFWFAGIFFMLTAIAFRLDR